MIHTNYGTYDGDSWEEYCQHLLKTKYNEDYQEMPAHTKGNYGIEGFTRSGLVFQCYCPDEEYDTKTLYKNQRKKITEDLGKLKKYKRELQRYFGPTKIKQWVFLTPKFTNKELVAHCQNKASEYRGMADAMDILDNNFDVLVKDEQFFLREILIVKQILKQKLPIDVDVREDEIIDWRNCNAEYVTTLFNKINVLFNDDEKYDFKRTNKYVYSGPSCQDHSLKSCKL